VGIVNRQVFAEFGTVSHDIKSLSRSARRNTAFMKPEARGEKVLARFTVSFTAAIREFCQEEGLVQTQTEKDKNGSFQLSGPLAGELVYYVVKGFLSAQNTKTSSVRGCPAAGAPPTAHGL
jgi:hypothetical protein